MSPSAWIFFLTFLFLGFCVFVLYMYWRMSRLGNRLSKKFTKDMRDHITRSVQHMPYSQQIIEYDKILDRVLGELGYRGTLAQKLRNYQKKYILPQAIWDAHKERNKLVHEVGYSLSKDESMSHVFSLKRLVGDLLGKS